MSATSIAPDGWAGPVRTFPMTVERGTVEAFCQAVGRAALDFTPRVTLVLGDPIPLPAAQPGDDEKRSKAVDVLHAEFIAQMTQLFDKYKAAAGYPEATLEVL